MFRFQPSTVVRFTLISWLACALLGVSDANANNNSRIIATGGGTSVEGSAGSGIVPWAVLSGYADEDELGGALGLGHTASKDFSMNVAAVAVNWRNRVELSFARQRFDIDNVAAGEHLQQNILGLKFRLAGDLIYPPLPQISLGIQYKTNIDFTIPSTLGANDDSGVDIYLAATKLWLNGPFNRSVFVNGTVRATRANQLGLLGFGGDKNSDHELVLELSAGLFFNRHWVVGADFRQKPNNLSVFEEDSWHDVFIGWFPNKRVTLMLAWVDLGSISGLDNQDGFHFSVQISQ